MSSAHGAAPRRRAARENRKAMRLARLPGGRRIWCTPRGADELRVVFQEVFEERSYERGGLCVVDGDVLVDVGSNVGLFALYFLEQRKNLRLVWRRAGAADPGLPRAQPRGLVGLERSRHHHRALRRRRCGRRDHDRVLAPPPGELDPRSGRQAGRVRWRGRRVSPARRLANEQVAAQRHGHRGGPAHVADVPVQARSSAGSCGGR